MANAAYRTPWRNLETGLILRYGSDTPLEAEETGPIYLPEHVTVEAMARVGI